MTTSKEKAPEGRRQITVLKSKPGEKLLGKLLFPFTPESTFPRAGGPVVENIGSWALLAFAFFWLLVFDLSQVAESVLLLVFLVLLFKGGACVLKRDPLLILLLFWLAYQFVYMPSVLNQYPDLAGEQLDYARHYARFGLILIVAWWLGASVRNVVMLLALAVAGFFLGVTFQSEGVLDSIERIRAHERLGLGYHNWEHVSVYAGFALITLGALGSRIVGLFSGRWRFAGYGFVGFGLAYSLFIVVVTQTRATWLGLFIAAFVATVFSLLRYARRKKATIPPTNVPYHRPRLLMVGAIAVSLAASLYLFDISKLVEKRLDAERDVVTAVLQGKMENIPFSSIGIRIVIWQQAVEWIAERPILGWGPKTRQALFENGELPQAIPMQFGIHHFHNQFLELAVAYGTAGIVIFGLVGFLVGRTAWRAWKDERIPDELMLFGLMFLSYWLTVNLFESYFNYSTGAYINALVGGAFYTFRFTERKV